MADAAGAVLAAVRGRRSIGRVAPDPVPADVVREMLEAAVWAPNHRLTIPWRFVVLEGEARDGLGAAHARAVGRARPGTPPEGLAAQALLPLRAPVVIACVMRPSSDDAAVRREDRDAVAAGIQNMLLVAHARGLGAIWRTGVMVDEHEVHAHLGLGDGDEIVGFVYVGTPAAETAAPHRPALRTLVDWRGRDGTPAEL